MDNPVVIIENINKQYGRRKKIFNDFSISFPANRVIGILGENGIGKTTLLKMIADIAKPDSGTIRVNGIEVSRHTRDLVSFLIEPANLYDFMKVSHAIQYFNDFYQDFDIGKSKAICDTFRLDKRDVISRLSKGIQERVCLMLCLSRKAPLYLLDEPMAGFDPKFKKEMIKVILAHMEEEQTLIISTHLLRDLESIFDEIVILTDSGAIMANTDDIRAKGQSIEDFYMEVVE